jgi:hypothetical protein
VTFSLGLMLEGMGETDVEFQFASLRRLVREIGAALQPAAGAD